ncbi:hypothetical protein [Paenibacillus sp. FSL R7-269]|uniref:hypothetical protein n=1 Tax=Paenibacillus sp. FSL R7-269 TaxID=1226755 RepID=UPI0012EB2357|nr:hypothetical protein [Paenibacillus sp. FSL R7-269]
MRTQKKPPEPKGSGGRGRPGQRFGSMLLYSKEPPAEQSHSRIAEATLSSREGADTAISGVMQQTCTRKKAAGTDTVPGGSRRHHRACL